MRRLLAIYVVVVVVAGASTSSALFSGRGVPFLDASDRDTVCTAALHYQPSEEHRAGAGASHTATSTATAAIRTNASSYRVGQPLLGLYAQQIFGVDSPAMGIVSVS